MLQENNTSPPAWAGEGVDEQEPPDLPCGSSSKTKSIFTNYSKKLKQEQLLRCFWARWGPWAALPAAQQVPPPEHRGEPRSSPRSARTAGTGAAAILGNCHQNSKSRGKKRTTIKSPQELHQEFRSEKTSAPRIPRGGTLAALQSEALSMIKISKRFRLSQIYTKLSLI